VKYPLKLEQQEEVVVVVEPAEFVGKWEFVAHYYY